tara:strand:- start:978 stop:1202 length:225 start_codon:yes stop_codon:yes gene_type:complete
VAAAAAPLLRVDAYNQAHAVPATEHSVVVPAKLCAPWTFETTVTIEEAARNKQQSLARKQAHLFAKAKESCTLP